MGGGRINNLGKLNYLQMGSIAAAVLILLGGIITGVYGSFMLVSVLLFWETGIKRKQIACLGLTRNKLGSSVVVGIVSGIILGVGAGSLLKMLGMQKYDLNSINSVVINNLIHKTVDYHLLNLKEGKGILYFIYMIFGVGLIEELFWRGFIQKKVAVRLSKNLAILVTAGIFALVHLHFCFFVGVKTGVIFMVMIALAGTVWGYMVEFMGSIWCAAVSHGITAFIIWRYYFFG